MCARVRAYMRACVRAVHLSTIETRNMHARANTRPHPRARVRAGMRAGGMACLAQVAHDQPAPEILFRK